MAALTLKACLEQTSILVIKVGSSLLIDEKGNFCEEWLGAIAEDIRTLHPKKKILIVSSGAIALGRKELALPRKRLKLEENQAAAAIGQIHLAQAWRAALQGIGVAQILLTSGDTEERRRYLNARNTLTTLLELRVIPIINENDTIATEEIRYGDNDRLAARVANMIGADALILLSSVDGLFSQDPNLGQGKLVRRIDKITQEIEHMAGDSQSDFSRGGMKTKLAAAHIAHQGGCHMIIARGTKPNPLRSLFADGACSWFPSPITPQAARKTWIAGGLKPQGAIYIDAGALRALRSGKSLLPAGVIRIEGICSRGDLLCVKTQAGQEVARGLSAYSNGDEQRIAGHKSDEIEALLGYRGRQAIIHRDDLVLFQGGK